MPLILAIVSTMTNDLLQMLVSNNVDGNITTDERK
jgi:hypothetical protein